MTYQEIQREIVNCVPSEHLKTAVAQTEHVFAPQELLALAYRYAPDQAKKLALLTLLAASFILPALPYLLAFAAGAMLYVVVEELIPEMSEGEHSHVGTILFAVGFSVMMVLDVLLG